MHGVSDIDPVVQCMFPGLKEEFLRERVVLLAVNWLIWPVTNRERACCLLLHLVVNSIPACFHFLNILRVQNLSQWG